MTAPAWRGLTFAKALAMPQTRNIPKPVARARAHLASLTARGADPAAIEAARTQLAEANAEADISRWPPMPAKAKVRLASLLLASGDDHAAT